MNSDWKDFLLAEQAIFEQPSDVTFSTNDMNTMRRIHPLTHFGILSVSGQDAATFLQGQLTCNINELTDNKASLAAMCNPKGRAIATLLVVKHNDAFLLILPFELLEKLQKRLQMYILRADVKLKNSTVEWCLIGLSGDGEASETLPDFSVNAGVDIAVNFPSGRRLILAETNHAIAFWSEQVRSGFQPDSSFRWRYLDIVSGIPWLTEATSEEFIPQMLNLDKLGGVSFNKGCYVGQEVIARTHYLGQAKREMLLAECDGGEAPAINTAIVAPTADGEQSVGKVLCAQPIAGQCKMLVVMQIADTDYPELILTDPDRTKIRLITH